MTPLSTELLWLVTGLGSGLALGLTGAGGGMIALPLLIYGIGLSLRDATVVALLAVVLGAAINGWVQRSLMDVRRALSIACFAMATSWAARPLKAALPEVAIAVLYVTIVATALLLLWREPSTALNREPTRHWSAAVGVGAVLGLLTSLTGLGGGAILVPLTMRVYAESVARATASSLLAVALGALAALLLQWPGLGQKPGLLELTLLVMGSLTAALAVRAAVSRVDSARMTLTRRLLMTVIGAASIVSVLVRTLA